MRSSGHVREDTGSSRRRIGVRGAMKRTVLISFLVASLLLAGCGQQGSGESEQGGSGPKESCDLKNPPLFKEGVLTVATDKPAYPPWFEGDPEHYSGYEGEVANEVAERMDLPIEWVVEPFNKSYAPGVLTMKDSPFAKAETISDLKDAKFGAQVGTTGLEFINETVEPNEEPKIYDTTNDAKSALESGQIDAMVTDLVTTVYLRDFEIKNSVVVGQYPRNEQFGMLFEQGNPLVGCVNQVLGEMKEDGTLQKLQKEYLQQYLSVPTLKE